MSLVISIQQCFGHLHIIGKDYDKSCNIQMIPSHTGGKLLFIFVFFQPPLQHSVHSKPL